MGNNTFFTASKTQFARQSEMLAAGKLCYGCMVKTPLSPYTNETICPPWCWADCFINLWAKRCSHHTFKEEFARHRHDGLAGKLCFWCTEKCVVCHILIRQSTHRSWRAISFIKVWPTAHFSVHLKHNLPAVCFPFLRGDWGKSVAAVLPYGLSVRLS